MSRLIAFGCSHTYGHSLEDCHIEPNMPGPLPSQFAWPQLLANRMNTTAINNSLSGTSNLHILWRILNFKFNQDDICVVQWTHFGRTPLTRLTYDSLEKEWLADNYDKALMLQIEETQPEHLGLRNYLIMHHAYMYLTLNKIKHIFISSTDDLIRYKIPPALSISTLREKIKFTRLDLALDKQHAGPKSHVLLAYLLYNTINELY